MTYLIENSPIIHIGEPVIERETGARGMVVASEVVSGSLPDYQRITCQFEYGHYWQVEGSVSNLLNGWIDLPA